MRTLRRPLCTALVAPLIVALVAGCSPSEDDRPDPAASRTAQEAASAAPDTGGPGGGVAPGESGDVPLDDRPFRLHVPAGYDAATAVPLLLLLHGYSSDSGEAEGYFRIVAASDERGFLVALPEGTADRRGRQFWDATDACCNFAGSPVDDSAYLAQVIDTVSAQYAVDPARVWVVGHSNGGFMAYRMACDHAELVTAVVSLAGAMTADAAACSPSRGVSVLQIHGTADQVIGFDGGANGPYGYPGAAESVAAWARLDGCTDQPETAGPLDLAVEPAGPETAVAAYTCGDGSRVELWTIDGGGHVPAPTDGFTPAVLDFLESTAA
jgi:polyhydroxybutyrate depolymerase